MKFYNNQPRVEKVIAIFQNILIFWRVLVFLFLPIFSMLFYRKESDTLFSSKGRTSLRNFCASVKRTKTANQISSHSGNLDFLFQWRQQMNLRVKLRAQKWFSLVAQLCAAAFRMRTIHTWKQEFTGAACLPRDSLGTIFLENFQSNSLATFLSVTYWLLVSCRRPVCNVCNDCRIFQNLGSDRQMFAYSVLKSTLIFEVNVLHHGFTKRHPSEWMGKRKFTKESEQNNTAPMPSSVVDKILCWNSSVLLQTAPCKVFWLARSKWTDNESVWHLQASCSSTPAERNARIYQVTRGAYSAQILMKWSWNGWLILRTVYMCDSMRQYKAPNKQPTDHAQSVDKLNHEHSTKNRSLEVYSTTCF